MFFATVRDGGAHDAQVLSKEYGMNKGTNSIDPTHLTIEQLTQLLNSVTRERISREDIERDLAAGAPVNTDGTVNLVQYSAWQIREMGRAE